MRFKLVPTDDKFFDLFSDSAANAHQAAKRLQELVHDYTDVAAKHDAVGRVRAARRRADVDDHAAARHVVRDAVRPRGHPRARGELDDICNDVLGVSDLMQLVQIDEVMPEMRELADLLVAMTEQLVGLFGRLKSMKGVQPYLEAIDRMETQGDALDRKMMARLLAEADALTVLKWKDIVAAMEAAINATEDASNVVESVVPKHA